MSKAIEITSSLLQTMPLPEAEGDKEARGRVMVVGGGAEVPGAVLLAGVSALRSGAGKLQVATCRSVAPYLALAVPEARVVGLPETPDGEIDPGDAAALLRKPVDLCGAVLIGPGMMNQASAVTLAGALLDCGAGPGFVLDAAAMAGLKGQGDLLKAHGGQVIITPHSGEMAGLLGIEKSEVEADPLPIAFRVSTTLHTVVVLKGATTWIATPDGRAWVNRHGCAGLGTSGSGDTLAGLITGLVARGAEPALAAIWGVYTHAEAGRRLAEAQGPLGFLAREIPGEIPRIMADLTQVSRKQ